MPSTEVPPGARCSELLKRLNEVEALMVEGGVGREGKFNAIAMLIADAILDFDDETLDHGLRKLKDIYRRIFELPTCARERGRVLGLIDVAQCARIRMVPKDLLAELTIRSKARQILSFLNHQPSGGATSGEVAVLGSQLRLKPDAVLSTMCSLEWHGLVRARPVGDASFWRITAKGRLALHLTRP